MITSRIYCSHRKQLPILFAFENHTDEHYIKNVLVKKKTKPINIVAL